MKKCIYFVALLFLVLLPHKVKAACSDSEMVRLQRIANNINVSAVFDENTKKFTIYLTNLKDELIVEDLYEGTEYSQNGELAIPNNLSGRHLYYIYTKNRSCGSNYIATKSINLLFYNSYYKSDLCKKYSSKYYCLKWVKRSINYPEWERNVMKYNLAGKNEEESTKVDSLFDTVIKVYSQYYFIILPAIIIIIGAILIIYNRKNRLA